MYLIIGATLPTDIRTSLLGLQSRFPDKSWRPEPFLFLPFCTLGEITERETLEDIDHALLNLSSRAPVPLTTGGFDVFQRKDRITLGIKIGAPEPDHLSVKIEVAMRRAGVRNPQPATPLIIPLADVTEVSPPHVNQWIQMHHPQTFSSWCVSEITLFRSWKNADMPLIVPEEDYPFSTAL